MFSVFSSSRSASSRDWRGFAEGEFMRRHADVARAAALAEITVAGDPVAIDVGALLGVVDAADAVHLPIQPFRRVGGEAHHFHQTAGIGARRAAAPGTTKWR